MLTLRSDRLRVELADPGEAPNNKFRFDHAGYITEIILDNAMRFCASEPQNLNHPNSGGRGLCNEYGFDTSSEAKDGEYFPKFGVGLIKKEKEEPYMFYKTYEDVIPFPVTVQSTENSVTYYTEAVPCLDYALSAIKTITLTDNKIIMTTTLSNVGNKTIDMREYCHNFISIDGMAVGSDYELSMPGIYDLGNERLLNGNRQSSHFRGLGKGLTFCEHTAIATDFVVDASKLSTDIPFLWRLSHRGAKAFVEAEEFFVPAQINIWGVDHMLCPEFIHRFMLAPGETHDWKRTWKFDKL